MEIVNLIISLISGALGGNAAGAALPEKNLGTLGNTISGLIGGGAGQYIVQALGLLASAATAGPDGAPHAANTLDIASIVSSIVGGGVGGSALTAIITLIKAALEKKS